MMKQSGSRTNSRRRRGLVTFALAALLAVGAVVPRAARGDMSLRPAVGVAFVAEDNAPDKRRGGNKLARVLSAPFRAIARLFGGGKKNSTEEARKKEERKAESAAPAAPRAANAADESRGRTKEDARRRGEAKQAGGAGQAPAVARAEAKAPESTAVAPNIVRPGDPSQTRQPGMWIPVIEGIPKDHLSQGRALLRHGYLNEAISELSVAATIGTDLIEANNLLGVAYDRLGWHKHAIEAYERALTVAPDDPQVLNNLGYSLYLQDDYKAALKRLKRAGRLAPGAPSVLNNLGLVQAKLGKYDDAYRNFALAGGEYNARLQIAEILSGAGRYPEAIKHYEAALRVQPNTAAVLERLAQLYERTGRRNEAEAARRALGQPKNPQKTTTGGGGG